MNTTFDKGCGNEPFDTVVAKIIELYAPKTLLAENCAYECLVAAFRNQGVRTYEIKTVGKTTLPDAFPDHFDMIVWEEGFTHLDLDEVATAVRCLSLYTDRILIFCSEHAVWDVPFTNEPEKRSLARELSKHSFFRDLPNSIHLSNQQVDVYCKRSDLEAVILEYDSWARCSSSKHERELGEARLGKQSAEELANAYQTDYLTAVEEIKDLRQKLSQSILDFNIISNAFFWKITKPFRLTLDKVKHDCVKVKPLYYTLRGIRSLKDSGLPITWNKMLFVLSRKKRMECLSKSFYLSDAQQKREQKTVFEEKITFSILVPLYNTPNIFLTQMIESVMLQTYSNWELCLADGSDSQHGYVETTSRSLARKDPRIRYQKLDKNLGISENTNACIDMSTGDYLALFDHDDILHPSALFEVMQVISKQKADYIYTDEATFEKRVDNIITAHFKPDFAIDNLRANNYICHFSVFSRKLLDKSGKFMKEFDGSQDHDMILRLTEQAGKIVHIPKLLYYWRSHPGSVAFDINSKAYAIDAGKRAVGESISRSGMKAVVESSKAFPAIYRIRYEITEKPFVSIIITNKDHEEELSHCISSILSLTSYTNYEILIVDNASAQKRVLDYYRLISTDARIKVIHWDEAFNFSAINNFAVTHASGDMLIFLNNDTKVITPGWIEEMLMYAQRKDVGAVGAKLYYDNNTIQHAGVVIGHGPDKTASHIFYTHPRESIGYMGRLYYAQDMSAVTGACMMIRKSIFIQFEGFDDTFSVAFHDIDLCMRLRKAGYLILFTPYAELYHYKSKKSELDGAAPYKARTQEELQLFRNKWEDVLNEGDPYYNPNFSPNKNGISLLEA